MLKLDLAELAKLKDRLADIEEKLAKKALRTAARKGMAIVRDEVKTNAPEDKSDDANGIKIKASVALMSRFQGPDLYVRVGIRGGAKRNPDTPYYFRMVEFGTMNQAAQPFMTPALESNADAVLERIAETLKAEFDRV